MSSMSTVAQKLCDEIVEPTLKTSIARVLCDKPHKKLGGQSSSSCKHPGKVTRSLVAEKKKVLNKFLPQPQNSHSSRTIINQIKATKIFKKSFADIAMNTIITGPLRCDTDCVTIVRKRDNHCTCKCGHKHVNSKVSAKQIQTLQIRDYSFVDRACAQCVETVNCGTQFLERISGGTPRPGYRSKNNLEPHTSKDHLPKSYELNFMSARRWALSKYPRRGPDF